VSGQEENLASALLEWCTSDEFRPTSSITGSGAVSVLERGFADMVDMRHAFAVASGTAALIGALDACTGEGGTVVLPAYDWSAALAAALACRCEVRFADVGRHGVIDADAVAAVGADADVIVATDLHGYPVDVIALRRRFPRAVVIEDCTQAIGARRARRPAGWAAHIAVWSLGSGKVIDAGEGGMIVTDDDAIAERLDRSTRHPVRQKSRVDTPCLLGTVPRMHPAAAIQAVSGLRGASARVSVDVRRARAALLVAHSAGLEVPPVEAEVEPSYSRAVVLVPEGAAPDGVEVGAPVYPHPPPSLIRQPTPPNALLWSTAARSVRLRDDLDLSRLARFIQPDRDHHGGTTR
jgi:dTDP-4-amino-4,6-dideoxygalactose transaminase